MLDRRDKNFLNVTRCMCTYDSSLTMIISSNLYQLKLVFYAIIELRRIRKGEKRWNKSSSSIIRLYLSLVFLKRLLMRLNETVLKAFIQTS